MYPKKLQKIIDWFSSFPGLGARSAERIALYILNMPIEKVRKFSNELIEMKKSIRRCEICGNYAQETLCEICRDNERNREILCIVEEAKDIFSLEKGTRIKPLYHVLGGKLSPVNGITPEDLNLKNISERITKEKIKEVIIATSSDMEGEATAQYIFETIKNQPVKITRIGFGIPYGTSFELANPATIEKSFENRIPLA